MRSMLLAAFLLMPLAGCAFVGGTEEAKDQGNRSFAPADVVVRGDGRILLAGLATRGGYKTDGYGECRGEGTATRDFAVVHLSSTGRIEGDYSVTERDLESCAVRVLETTLDAEGGLRVMGVVHEPPGFTERIFGPGSSTPEQSERSYTARFAPEGPFDEEDDSEHGYPPGAPFAYVRLPNGDWVVIEEDTLRQRRDPHGLYVGTISLARLRMRPDDPQAARLWSFPIPAISSKVDLELEAPMGWALFFDPRRGFYGFAQYSPVSGDPELVLFRHGLDGRPDGSFGDKGRVLVAPGVAWSGEVVRDRAGDLVVVAQAGGKRSRLVVRRYDADGRQESEFGEAAEEALGDGLSLDGVAVQPDGKLLIAAGPRAGERGPTVIFRLLQSGRLDPGFGRNGRVVIRKI